MTIIYLISDVPLPPETMLSEPTNLQPPLPPLENGQPLPPGVDLLPDAYNKPKVSLSSTIYFNALCLRFKQYNIF